MKVRIYGDKILREIARKIDEITNEIVNLSSEMISTMHKHDGLGLAAPQVGISKRLIVIDFKVSKTNVTMSLTSGEAMLIPQMPISLVNPEILSFSEETRILEEGCLSVPRIYGKVKRSEKIMLKAQFLSGEKFTIECGGLLATALQHEIDHLNGILFVDKLTPLEFDRIKNNLNKLKRL